MQAFYRCRGTYETKGRACDIHTFAVEPALLCGALALVEVLVAHLRGHRDAFSGGLGDVLGHPQPPSDDVPQERHLSDRLRINHRDRWRLHPCPGPLSGRPRQMQRLPFSDPDFRCRVK